MVNKKMNMSKSMNVDEYSSLLSVEGTDEWTMYENMEDKTIILLSKLLGRRPQIWFCCYYVEFWFSNTRNPDPSEVMRISYNQLETILIKCFTEYRTEIITY
jgi:hypothetical protein